MKIGIFTALFHDRPIDEALDVIAEAGIQAVELGAGAYPGSRHLDDVGGVEKFIKDDKARRELRHKIESRGLTLDSLSVHGNPLHPDKAIAEEHHKVFENAVLLAEKLELGVVNGFSGCPGDGPRAKNPNWVTCPWPDEYRDILDYQWKKVAIPYWKRENKFLKQHNVKFAIEAHPGFHGLQPGDDLEAARRGGRPDRRELRPVPLLVAGH